MHLEPGLVRQRQELTQWVAAGVAERLGRGQPVRAIPGVAAADHLHEGRDECRQQVALHTDKTQRRPGTDHPHRDPVFRDLIDALVKQEKWQEGINALNEWFATAVNPNSTAYYLLAVAYYQLKKPDQALAPAQKAVDLSETPRESWVQLLLALRIEKEQYQEAIPLLKQLVMADPSKKNYWVQLSAVNRQLERYDDSLAVLEIANMAGLLTTDSDLRPLTDLEAFVGIPYRAATNLDKYIAKGRSNIEQLPKALVPRDEGRQSAAEHGHYYYGGRVLRMHPRQWAHARCVERYLKELDAHAGQASTGSGIPRAD